MTFSQCWSGIGGNWAVFNHMVECVVVWCVRNSPSSVRNCQCRKEIAEETGNDSWSDSRQQNVKWWVWRMIWNLVGKLCLLIIMEWEWFPKAALWEDCCTGIRNFGCRRKDMMEPLIRFHRLMFCPSVCKTLWVFPAAKRDPGWITVTATTYSMVYIFEWKKMKLAAWHCERLLWCEVWCWNDGSLIWFCLRFWPVFGFGVVRLRDFPCWSW